MTWNQIVDSNEGGNGAIEYRLEVDGLDYSFVTSMDMANLSTMPKRINGLTRKGISISQKIQLPEAMINANSNNFEIVDYQEQATIALYRKPTYTGYLTQNTGPTDLSIYLSNADQLNRDDYIWIGSECMKVIGKFSSDLNRVLVARGQLNTIAQSHYILTDLGIPIKPFVQNVPFTLERKRARLYAYGRGDNMQGDGTLIWRGLVLKQPAFQGTKYTLEVGPITELLKSEIGTDSEEIKLRGFNFGLTNWVIEGTIGNTNNLQNYTSSSIFYVSASGFYEDIYSLVQDLNNQVVFNTNNQSIKAGVLLSQQNELLFTQYTTGSNLSIRWRTTYNPLAAILKGTEVTKKDIFEFENPSAAYLYYSSGPKDDPASTISPSQTYAHRLIARQFPQQLSIYSKELPLSTDLRNRVVNLGFNLSYAQRFYINSNINSSMTNVSFIDSDGNSIAANKFDQPLKGDIVINSTERYIQTPLFTYNENIYNNCFAIVDNDYKIQIGTSFEQNTTEDIANNVVDFLELLIARTPYDAQNGTIPILTTDDIDISDMRTQINKLSLKPYQNQRKYIFFKKAGSLDKFLNDEFKLIGVYPVLTSEGKISIRPLRNINPYESPEYTFDSDEILTDNGYPTIITNQYGVWNSISVKTGYDSVSDKFLGPVIVQNNIDSISQIGRTKQITIEPKSQTQYVSNQASAYVADFEDILYRSTSLFSSNYSVVNFDVPIKYFNLPLGSIVRIKNKQLPNYTANFSYLTSRRGSARILGRVTEKSFDLEKGYGNLSVLISDQEFDGNDTGVKAIYAPDAVVSLTSLGGNIYSLTMDPTISSMFLPSNQTQSDFWFVGDAISLRLWDVAGTDLSALGVITAISGTGNNLVLTVEFNTAGTTLPIYPTERHLIRPATFNSVLLQDRQKIYTFIDNASTSGNVNQPGTLNRIYSF